MIEEIWKKGFGYGWKWTDDFMISFGLRSHTCHMCIFHGIVIHLGWLDMRIGVIGNKIGEVQVEKK